MKIGGMGDSAIRLEAYELRRLVELPQEVRIVRILPDQHGKAALDLWRPNFRPEFPQMRLFIHVRHRYCYRLTHPGMQLTVFTLDEFMRQLRDMRQLENDNAGKRVEEDPLQALNQMNPMWVDDETPDEQP